MFSFSDQGLIYYQDGRQVQKGTQIPGNYPTDLVTSLTVGKPNKGEKYYGRLKMDTLVVWYRALSSDEIGKLIIRSKLQTKILKQLCGTQIVSNLFRIINKEKA